MLLDIWTLCYIYMLWTFALQPWTLINWMQNMFWTRNWMYISMQQCTLASSSDPSVATRGHSRDSQMTSSCPALLETTITINFFCPSLLCSHCRDTLVTTCWLTMTTVTYGPLLQCMFIVVHVTWIEKPVNFYENRPIKFDFFKKLKKIKIKNSKKLESISKFWSKQNSK
jgi:hypothetical protein